MSIEIQTNRKKERLTKRKTDSKKGRQSEREIDDMCKINIQYFLN